MMTMCFVTGQCWLEVDTQHTYIYVLSNHCAVTR